KRDERRHRHPVGQHEGRLGNRHQLQWDPHEQRLQRTGDLALGPHHIGPEVRASSRRVVAQAEQEYLRLILEKEVAGEAEEEAEDEEEGEGRPPPSAADRRRHLMGHFTGGSGRPVFRETQALGSRSRAETNNDRRTVPSGELPVASLAAAALLTAALLATLAGFRIPVRLLFPYALILTALVWFLASTLLSSALTALLRVGRIWVFLLRIHELAPARVSS